MLGGRKERGKSIESNSVHEEGLKQSELVSNSHHSKSISDASGPRGCKGQGADLSIRRHIKKGMGNCSPPPVKEYVTLIGIIFHNFIIREFP